MNKYEDIIYFNYELNHLRMPIYERASIFSPFSALSGYNEMIDEEERVIDKKVVLSDDQKNLLDRKINIIKNKLPCKVLIKYFIPDLKKEGGKYISKEINIYKFDLIKKVIKTEEKEEISFDSILDIKKDK